MIDKKLQQRLSFFVDLAINKEPVAESLEYSANLVVTDLQDLQLGVQILVEADKLGQAKGREKIVLEKWILVPFLKIIPKTDEDSVEVAGVYLSEFIHCFLHIEDLRGFNVLFFFFLVIINIRGVVI